MAATVGSGMNLSEFTVECLGIRSIKVFSHTLPYYSLGSTSDKGLKTM